MRPTAGRVRAAAAICLATLVSAGAVSAQGASRRRFSVGAMLHLEGLGAVAPSPSGTRVAVVVQRARESRATYEMPWTGDNSRGDVWIAGQAGRRAYPITPGIRDGSGWWDPVWSPDGKRLAMLSTEGGDAVRAYVWTVGEPAPRRVATQAVDIWVTSDPQGRRFQPLTWLDNRRLLLPLLPRGASPRFDPVGESETAAERGWALARRGTAPTASVLESLPGKVPPYLSTEALVALDVRTGRAVTLATIPRDPTTSGRRALVLAPGGHRLAVLTTVLDAPSRQRLTPTMSRFRLGILDIATGAPVRWLGSYRPNDRTPDAPLVLRWAPDGETLAIVGRPSGMSEAEASCALVIDARSGRIRPIGQAVTDSGTNERGAEARASATPPCLDVAWTPDGVPIALVRTPGGRADWWTIGRRGIRRDITRAIPGGTRFLLSSSAPGTLVAVANQSAWAIGTRASKPENLLASLFPKRSVRIVWPDGEPDARGVTDIIAEVGQPTSAVLYAISLAGSRPVAHRIGKARPGWRVAGYLRRSKAAVLVERNHVVAVVSASDRRRQVDLLRVNGWATQITRARRMIIRYPGDDGDSLSGVLMLPVRDTTGRRFPLVVWVYPGETYSDTSQIGADPFSPSPLNLLLLAAHGYAVLFPSMPLGPENSNGSDVLVRLPGSVIPAVNRAVESGRVDPNRVAVMGQSYGGYATLGLITETARFRSAIALAPISDYISEYGTFRPWDRYTASPQVSLAEPKQAEARQLRLGGSPWTRLPRYLEDSPLFHADRVSTPALLIQGDQDFVGINQSEEFFTALYRLGKRARFVRYWGEGHVIESPANIRDMWTRIFDWLETTMPPALAGGVRSRQHGGRGG